MSNNSNWKTLSQKYIYQSKWLKLRHDEVIRPDGNRGEYDVVEKKDFVLIIPKVGEVFYLVEQERYPVNARSLEFPQGNTEEGETEEQAAKREFEEETGFKTETVKEIGFLWLACGHHTQGYKVFLVEEFNQGQKHLEGSESDMITLTLTEQELEAKIKQGEIKDASTVAAFALYKLNK